MINALLLEKFAVKNICIESHCESEQECKDNHLIAKERSGGNPPYDWEYPRKALKGSCKSEKLFYWSESDNQLCYVENEYLLKESDYELVPKNNPKVNSIIKNIKPVSWHEVYFSKLGICTMFISQNGELYYINNNENRRIMIEKIKIVLNIIPLKEGIIVVGYHRNEAELVVNTAIFGHPLGKPTDLVLKDTNNLSGKHESEFNKLVIWGSVEYPLIMAYDKIKKNHGLYVYNYLSFNSLIAESFWEYPNEEVELAKTVFISKAIFESNIVISYHIPSILELRLIIFSESEFKNICCEEKSSVGSKEPFVQTIENVKDVVPIKFGYQHEKYELFGINYLYGLNYADSSKLFNQGELHEFPTFYLLLNSGKALLYTGSRFISNVNIELENVENLELLGISSAVSNNFDALVKYDDHFMGIRCSIKLLPDDFFVQILTRLLIKITHTDFSLNLFKEIVMNRSSEHWNILCRALLGVSRGINQSEQNCSNTNFNGSIESPMSNGVYKRIKLFSDRDDCSNNKSKTWQEITQFWIKYLEKNGKSPFDRIEFSNLISKGIIPHEFLKGKLQKSINSLGIANQPLEFSVSTQYMYILHALYEELSLFPQFNVLGNYQSRLMNDILIPLSTKLCTPNYYEYYQYLGSSFNFIQEEKDHSIQTSWDLPPVLLDKLYFLTKFSRLNKKDVYLKVINEHFPLQCFTIRLYEQLINGSRKRETIDLISRAGVTNAVLPILSPIISLPIEKFLNNYSNNAPELSFDDNKYSLLGRFDMLSHAKNTNYLPCTNYFLKTVTDNSDNLVASVLPHGRNTVDDQKSMLENLQVYYKNKMDPSRIISFEKRTVAERWKNDLTESSDLGSLELSYKWCFQVFSYDNRFCDVLEILSLENPPHILLQRSSGAYPIDEESWDEFQRQRVVDAVQLVYTNLLGRAACTLGGFAFDISLNKLTRPVFVNRVYEVASNSLISIDVERFKEVCFDISIWNEFYIGITQSLKYCFKKYKFLYGVSTNRKSWLIEQLDTFSSQDDIPFISGFLYGISLNGFFNADKSTSITNFPLILEPKEIYKILENDGRSIKTCSILLATAVSAIKSQNTLLLRLYLMHIPSILPNIYSKSLQISSISQYSAISSIGLLFSQSRSRQVVEILFSEFLRTISDIDDQALINPSLYSISAAISLGMVLQPSDESSNIPSNTMVENNINNILLSCISGNKVPKFLSNLASGPNLEHYTEFSGLKRFKHQNESMDKENSSKSNNNLSSDADKFSNSSKNYCSKIVDSTILGIPAALSLSIMHIRSKNKCISSSITIPFNQPEELVNYRPETLIFMSMAKIVIEWEENCAPNIDFIRNKIPGYLLYLPPDKIFPFPITPDKLLVAEPMVDTKLMHCISAGALDWIHCIQARIAILSGIIWGLGIVFAGKRNVEVKHLITTILEYLDRIPLIQMPLSIASTIRDPSICSSLITIDRWSRELCIRVCLTSVSICFSGSGDKQILTQIKYFRAQLLESAQLLWTSSTAISPFSIFSIPPIEHVNGQLMAFSNALGFLFLSAGHSSFGNNSKLGSTFLLLATHPIYPRDSSDFNTPGIIFQPLRYLFITATEYGRKVVVPKLVVCSPEPNDSCNYSGIISEEKIFVPVSVELKTNDAQLENSKIEYYILPSILPDWDDIINIKVLGDGYYPISINFIKDRNTNCFQRLLGGQLWVQSRNRYHGYSWNEANHVINHIKNSKFPKVQSFKFLDDQIYKQQLLCRYYGQYDNILGNNSSIINQCDEINDLYNDFSHTLVLDENKPLVRNYRDKSPPNIKMNNCILWCGTILDNYIDRILSTWNKITQDGGDYQIQLSPDIIKILRITLNLDNNSKLQTILLNIHRRLQAQMSVIIRCVRYYYGAHNGTRTPSCDERQSLRLFLSLNGMPIASHFNYVLKSKIESSKKINALLREDYSKYEEAISPVLVREFPCLSSLGLQILKVFAYEYFTKMQKVGSQSVEAQQQIKTMLTCIFSSKNHF